MNYLVPISKLTTKPIKEHFIWSLKNMPNTYISYWNMSFTNSKWVQLLQHINVFQTNQYQTYLWQIHIQTCLIIQASLFISLTSESSHCSPFKPKQFDIISSNNLAIKLQALPMLHHIKTCHFKHHTFLKHINKKYAISNRHQPLPNHTFEP